MRRSIYSMALATLGILAAASAAQAQFVFGSFEDSAPDGFGSFSSTSGVIPFTADTTGSTYSYGSYGATNGSVALDVNHAGYSQDLGFDFVASGDLAQFMANDILSFDITSPPAGTATAGYWQLYSVALNAPGGGFQNQGGASPLYNQYYYNGFNGAETTISVNYDAYKATLAANPGYLQMVVAINPGGGAPNDFYFDNFRLSPAPEPACLESTALAALGLLRRRRA